MAAGGPLRAVRLHHPLTTLGQQPDQAGAVAAGTLHRPHPRSGVLLSEGKQGLVAGRGGGDGLGGQNPTGGRGQDRSGVGRLWVSTPMTTRTSSARMGMRSAPWPEDAGWYRSGWSTAER
jgi:hypothetical protein